MKIAIFNFLPHNYIGGIESYSKVLIETCLKNGWDVTEFSMINPDHKQKVTNKISNVKQKDVSKGNYYFFKGHKWLNRVIKDESYDIIINNTITTKKSFKSNKVITVQHMDWKWYSPRSADSWFRILNSIFLGLGYWRNPLKAKNVVFYSAENDRVGAHNPLYQFLPLKKEFTFINRNKSGNKIFWLGRFEEPHKGLRLLNEIHKNSRHSSNFVIGGDGPDSKYIKEIKNKNKIGKLETKEITRIFNKSKVFIMTSNTEGFAFTLVEALAHGTPIVMFDSFTAASFYGRCPAVKLIKHKDIKAFNEAVDEIMSLTDREWLKISKEATSFAKEHFSVDSFKKNWTKYIKEVAKK